jgi:hypothetical protein
MHALRGGDPYNGITVSRGIAGGPDVDRVARGVDASVGLEDHYPCGGLRVSETIVGAVMGALARR